MPSTVVLGGNCLIIQVFLLLNFTFGYPPVIIMRIWARFRHTSSLFIFTLVRLASSLPYSQLLMPCLFPSTKFYHHGYPNTRTSDSDPNISEPRVNQVIIPELTVLKLCLRLSQIGYLPNRFPRGHVLLKVCESRSDQVYFSSEQNRYPIFYHFLSWCLCQVYSFLKKSSPQTQHRSPEDSLVYLRTGHVNKSIHCHTYDT